MNSKKSNRKFFLQPRTLLIIFLVMAVLMISSALIELQQSKKELLTLMERQAHSLLESLIIASQNSLKSSELLQKLSKDRLLNNASLVKDLFEKNLVNNDLLREISEKNKIFRINIFNSSGQKIYASHQQEHFDLPENNSPLEILQPIFSGETDTLIIGIKAARYEEGYRYAVALAAKNNSAIVLNIDASQILNFEREIGFGKLLRNVIQNEEIIYVALQDSFHILAASGNVKQLERIEQSKFLSSALMDSTFKARTVVFDSLEVFETVHPFGYRGETIGLFRIGLSLQPIEEINSRIFRRLIIITIILILSGSILFTLIFVRQRYDLLQKQYQVVETYSSNIIQNVSDAIIVFDKIKGIKIFNKTAELLFKKQEKDVLGLTVNQLLPKQDFDNFPSMQQVELNLNHQVMYLLVSRSTLFDSEGIENTILIIRDLTRQKKLEEQMQRKERLSAMGELASGVAHEIRNPLNTIGTIAQQLRKDFKPVENKEEFSQLSGLVYKEVKRINTTIEDFLKFARPQPLTPSEFELKNLIAQIKQQYQSMAKAHQIELKIYQKWNGNVIWDEKQIKQVLMNLMQNAIDAIKNDGMVTLSVNKTADNEIEIMIKDNGAGMLPEIRSKIFNLYYTTKAKGTGIGLSIVQKIVYEHGGVISVESEPEKGTSFTVKLPERIEL